MVTVHQTEAFSKWFRKLGDMRAKDRIVARIRRVEVTGNFGDVRNLKGAVNELRVDYGPGYRLYFTERQGDIVILLCGGDKRTQNRRHRSGQGDGQGIGGVKDMALETRPWDVTEHLDSPERIAGYLEAVFEDGDPALIYAALGDVARAKGMSSIAKETGLSRESLYRALSPEGHPEFGTILKVLKALGLRIAAEPDKAAA